VGMLAGAGMPFCLYDLESLHEKGTDLFICIGFKICMQAFWERFRGLRMLV
jgi:hypothetical protein